MHFSMTAAALATLSLASSVMAKPVESRSPVNQYHIKTKVVDYETSTGTDKDGLYLFSYHTGAGLGAGGLTKDKPDDSTYFSTGADNQQLLHYPQQDSPYVLGVDTYGPYQAWVPATINLGGSTPGQGFTFSGTDGIVFNNTNNGWLACDWWYSEPTLFLLQTGYSTAHPASCSIVQLVTETVY